MQLLTGTHRGVVDGVVSYLVAAGMQILHQVAVCIAA